MKNIHTELNKIQRFNKLSKDKKDLVVDNLLKIVKHSNGIINRQTFEKGNFVIKYLGDLHERRIEFEKNVLSFQGIKYDIGILSQFYNYWSELDQKGEKMRWECQEFFEISKRLSTWKRKSQGYNKDNYATKYR